MSAFLVGYMIIAIIVLIAVNMLFGRGSKKRQGSTRQEKQIDQPNDQQRRFAKIEAELKGETPVDHSFTEFVNDDEDTERSLEESHSEQSLEKVTEQDEEERAEESLELELSRSRSEEQKEELHPLSRRRKHELEAKNNEGNTHDQRAHHHDDEEVAPKDEVRKGPIITVILLGAFVAILNQTLMNVAIPHMMTDLNVTANTAQWLITGYMLVNGVCIPLTAFLMESFTTRKLFLTAMFLFGIGALICAIAPGFSILLVGRIVQAAGAGIIMPLMMNTLLAIFPPEKRGAAMGMVGIAMVFAPAVGPTLSGYIVEHYTWRLLFWVVIPIAVIDIIVAAIWLQNVTKLSYPKFDFWGLVTSTLGFGGILYAFSEAGNSGWDSAKVMISLIVGIIALILFIVRELTADVPMLEFRVFKYPMFSLTTAVSAVITMAMFAAMILVPIYLQNIRGFTPIQSGLLLLPGAILMGIMSPIAGILFDKIGARALAIVGLLITGVTTWQFSQLTSQTTYTHLIVLYSFRMFGMSMLMMPIMTAGLNALPRRLNAHGTAMANTMRQVAGSLGTAFLVTVMSNRTNFHLGDYGNLMNTNNTAFAQQFAELGNKLAGVMGMPSAYGRTLATYVMNGLASEQSAIQGINDAFLVATGLVVVAFVLALFIKRTTPPTED